MHRFLFGFSGNPEGSLRHGDHQHHKNQQVQRQNPEAGDSAQDTEHQGHDGGAQVGGGHLDADDGGGILRAEVIWGGVDDAGVHRGAAEADDEKSGKGQGGASGNQQEDTAAGQNGSPQQNHPPVSQPVHYKAPQKPPCRNADVAQGGKPGGLLRGNALGGYKVGAGPVHGGNFNGAVGEKAQQQGRNTPDFQGFQNPHRPLALLRCLGNLLPHRQGQKQHQGDAQLQKAHNPVAQAPGTQGQGVAHHKGADDGAHPPEAVEPAHVPGGVVLGHKVVEGGVNGSRPQAVGNGKDHEHNEIPGNGKAQKGRSGEKHAGDRHPGGAEPPGEPAGKETGYNGSQGDDGGENAHKGNRDTQLQVHHRPPGAQQRVRQPQAHKGQIHKTQQKGIHGYAPSFHFPSIYPNSTGLSIGWKRKI